MARPRSVPEPDPDVTVEDPSGELTETEIEKLAAGDMAFYGDPIFEGYQWTIRRKRSREDIAADPEGGPFETVTKKIGPLDPVSVMPEIGGGTFEFLGYYDKGDGRGKKLSRRFRQSFVGPRKDFALALAPAATTRDRRHPSCDATILTSPARYGP